MLMAGSWTWMVIEGPFQLKPFCDSGKAHGFSSFLSWLCPLMWQSVGSLHLHVNAVRVAFQDLALSLLSCHEMDHSKGCFPTLYLVTWGIKSLSKLCSINMKSAQTF